MFGKRGDYQRGCWKGGERASMQSGVEAVVVVVVVGPNLIMQEPYRPICIIVNSSQGLMETSPVASWSTLPTFTC
jgi:hypothetical protein